MAWVRLDEDFAQHPKVAKAGPLGMAMHVAALCYCNRHLTDGFVPKQIARTLLDLDGLGMRMWSGDVMGGGQDAEWSLIIDDLVNAGLWEPVEGGWAIHDYLDYQPSREHVQEVKAKRSEAGSKGGTAKRKQFAKQNAEQNEGKVLSKSPSKTEAKSKPDPVPDTDNTPTGADEPSPFVVTLDYLRRNGTSDRNARSVIGRWRKKFSDGQILDATAAAKKAQAAEPVSYITKTLEGEASDATSPFI